MRKTRHILLPLLALSLIGCGKTEPESGIPATSETVSVTTQSENESETPVKTYRYNEAVDDALDISLGEYVDELPYLTADRYTAENRTMPSYGIIYTTLSCYSSQDPAGLVKVYKASANLMGYDMTTSDGYVQGYKRLAPDTLIFITFGAFEDSKTSESGVAIACWIQHDKQKTFPSDAIRDFLGTDLPEVEADYYSAQQQTMQNIEVLVISCFNAKESEMTAFGKKLENDGYVLTDYGSATTAENKDRKVGLQFVYYTAEDAAEVGYDGTMPVLTIIAYKE